MKLAHDQLAAHLSRPLRPVYLLAGDEILFMEEASQALRAAAQQAGFAERYLFNVDQHFDWSLFQNASQAGSLFSDKQYLELRLASTKLSEAGKKALLHYLEWLPANKIVVITCEKLDAAAQKTAWVKAIEAKGVLVSIWPLASNQMAPWIIRRLEQRGLKAEMPAVQLLIARTQGNLLAAAQEIEKLSLLYPQGSQLNLLQVNAASANNTRFNVFDLNDAILQNQVALVVKILRSLEDEGTEPTLILWTLTRELRQLIPLATAVAAGKSLESALNSPGVWEKRKPWIKRTLLSHSLTTLQACLCYAARLDALIKGAASGSIWDELTSLAFAIAGGKANYLPAFAYQSQLRSRAAEGLWQTP